MEKNASTVVWTRKRAASTLIPKINNYPQIKLRQRIESRRSLRGFLLQLENFDRWLGVSILHTHITIIERRLSKCKRRHFRILFNHRNTEYRNRSSSIDAFLKQVIYQRTDLSEILLSKFPLILWPQLFTASVFFGNQYAFPYFHNTRLVSYSNTQFKIKIMSLQASRLQYKNHIWFAFALPSARYLNYEPQILIPVSTEYRLSELSIDVWAPRSKM